MTMAALAAAAAEAKLGSEREHVTLFIRNRPDRFRAGRISSPTDLSALRWTVDYADDLALVRRLAESVADPLAADRYDFLRAWDALGLSGGAHARNEGLASSVARDADAPDQAD
jgi:spore coat polysaccharide biosynthesis protein SpsF